jgi:hypothetical protein
MKLVEGLASCGGGFSLMIPIEVIGSQVIQTLRPPARVVPTLNPPKDCQSGLSLGFPAPPGNELAFQAGKKLSVMALS